MKSIFAAAALSIATLAAVPAMAQSARPVTQADTNSFLYDQAGTQIGGFYRLHDGQAIITASTKANATPVGDGFYTVPAYALTVRDGHVVLTGETVAEVINGAQHVALRDRSLAYGR